MKPIRVFKKASLFLKDRVDYEDAYEVTVMSK